MLLVHSALYLRYSGSVSKQIYRCSQGSVTGSACVAEIHSDFLFHTQTGINQCLCAPCVSVRTLHRLHHHGCHTLCKRLDTSKTLLRKAHTFRKSFPAKKEQRTSKKKAKHCSCLVQTSELLRRERETTVMNLTLHRHTSMPVHELKKGKLITK